MRYIVQQVQLAKNHPIEPCRNVFKILDLNNGLYGLSYYVTIEAAHEMCSIKNRR